MCVNVFLYIEAVTETSCGRRSAEGNLSKSLTKFRKTALWRTLANIYQEARNGEKITSFFDFHTAVTQKKL